MNLKERLTVLTKNHKIKFEQCFDAGGTLVGDFYIIVNGVRSRVQLDFNNLSDEELLRFIINPILIKKEKLMTRNEAIEFISKKLKITKDVCFLWIDFFIEAGMLKVEEEKDTIRAKLSSGGYNTDTLIFELDKIGLKIVEK